jgi:hypothetical protein
LSGDEVLGDSASDLGDLKTVRQTVVEDFTFSRRYNLGHARQPAKFGCIQDAVTIALRRHALIVARTIFLVEALVAKC